MKASVLSIDELTDEHRTLWSDAQLANEPRQGPFFRPEFFEVISRFRSNVCVAVLQEDSEIAFFPFEYWPHRTAKPAGSPLSDFQGLITSCPRKWNIADILRSCGLRSWRFDHLLTDQIEFADYQCAVAPSPFIDLSEGFEAYVCNRPNRGSKNFPNLRRAKRCVTESIGTPRFEFDVGDTDVFDKLVSWKRYQYASTRSLDPFEFPWVIKTLEELRSRRSDALRGVVSALYFGKRLAAAHLGIRSAHTLHYWFPAYDPALSEYSPGMMCLIEIARQARAHGITRIDLGKGDEFYKRRLMSGAAYVAEGSVATGGTGQALEYARRRLVSVSTIPYVGVPIQKIARLYRRINRRRRYG